MSARVAIPIALLLWATAAQAAGAGPPLASGPAAQLNRDLKRHRFYHAMRLLEPVRLHLKKADAGAWNRVYRRTLKLTASTGQNEWPVILADPAIPIRFKHALVDRIDRAAGGDHRGELSAPVDAPKARAQLNASVPLRDALDQKRFRVALRLLKEVEVELKDVGEGAWGYEYENTVQQVATWGRRQWAGILSDSQIPLAIKHDLVSTIDETGRETKAAHDSDVARWAHRYRHHARLAGVLIQQVPDSGEQESAYLRGHPAMILYVFKDGRVNQVEFRPDGRITSDWWWRANPGDPVWVQLWDVKVGLAT